MSNAESNNNVVRAIRTIAAPAEKIFDVLADPRQHSVIDGSGSVQSAQSAAPERLALGTKFGMSMKIGVPYKIDNEVVEFDEGRRIAWRHFGGHIWRYILEPVESGTTVTEEFDWSHAKSPMMLKAVRAPQRNQRAMEATLAKLAAHLEA
jgi:uncharacterized protein YndB with AHSA1/START domain